MDLSGQIRRILTNMSASDASILRFVDNINNIIAQIEEVNYGIKNRLKDYDFDPEKIQELESRLHLISDLKRKYQTDEIGLSNILKETESRLSMIDDESGFIDEAKEKFDKAYSSYKSEAVSFLEKRKKFGTKLSASINQDLGKLGMSGTKFSVQQPGDSEFDSADAFGDIESISPHRVLRGGFMVATNVGQDMRPLARIASGGELSRIMLALKVQQKKSHDATMIFDEIDSGISGDTAIMMAQRLKDLSEGSQTIVVSHLHSLASLADTHLLISKDVEDGATSSHLKKVTGKERVMELARMMGGSDASSVVIEHAKELMKGSRPKNRTESI
jgi:DNA repair protein RecN (Recombination protein N)